MGKLSSAELGLAPLARSMLHPEMETLPRERLDVALQAQRIAGIRRGHARRRASASRRCSSSACARP